ncbi:MAG: GtrA family protein [Micropepsaceae bacterium]
MSDWRAGKLSDEVLRLVRFGLVGGSSAAAYSLVLLALVTYAGAGSIVASALAYVIAIPVSFLGQKYFTFRSQGAVQRELPAFVALQAVNLVAAVFVTYVTVDVIGASHYAGILAVVCTIALISYGAMALAIFR